MATDPKDVVATRPVVAVIAAGLGLVAGLGGAKLTSPDVARAPEKDLVVHMARIEQQRDGGSVLEAFSTTVFTLADGGTKPRDNGYLGPRRCVAGASVAKALSAISTDCAPKQAGTWLHVVELRPTADGGTAVEAYASRALADGGAVDLGRVACKDAAAADVADIVFKEALACAEPVLDEP